MYFLNDKNNKSKYIEDWDCKNVRVKEPNTFTIYILGNLTS